MILSDLPAFVAPAANVESNLVLFVSASSITDNSSFALLAFPLSVAKWVLFERIFSAAFVSRSFGGFGRSRC